MQESFDNPSTSDQNAAVDKYNVEAAELLANKAQQLPIAKSGPIYEQLLATFPTAAKFWKQYVEAYMAINNDDATKQIFSRCLLICYHIPLWQCYIRFIRKANQIKGAEGQDETKKAFDFMLSCVGADIGSGPVWMEYITFLKSLPASNRQEESQRMSTVRKVYQRAVVTPTHYVEQLWKDYENFENSVSRDLAKGLLSDFQPKYNSARAIYRERNKYVDEIDWLMLAVPPIGSCKDEVQWIAWKKYLAFEKGNPQRIDSASANKRIIYTYEQCLMYLYHYPDIWYDYAMWHAKTGSVDASIKVFQRALKALPDSELLKFAYAELEESRGSLQPAKKIYESLLGDRDSASTLAHIQFIRFLRRTEGVEAARKYFIDARKSPSCTFHVYVAYAMMAFCLDKDPKVAHSVFEAGLKIFMHEPEYILKYADFLSRLNDDRNIRALFERALSSLPAKDSVEVWKQFIQFEQVYGDLTSILKVEQRRKEALSGSGEDGSLVSESSLQDVVSRYSYMDLWPCSSKDLENLARQEKLAKTLSKKLEKSYLPNGMGSADKTSVGLTANSSTAPKISYPDTSRMVIYEPKQSPGIGALVLPPFSSGLSIPSGSSANGGKNNNVFDETLKATSPVLATFIANLPIVEGPLPDVDFLLTVLLQSNIPLRQSGKSGSGPVQLHQGAAPGVREASGSSKFQQRPSSSFRSTRERQPGKRKERDKQDDDETTTVQSAPLPRDIFRIRQTQKARKATSQTGSASYSSALSGELSGSTS